MRGRKPKPKALKILEGAQKCRINQDEPVYPSAGAPEPPAWLGEHGKELWRTLYPLLNSAGVLSAADLPAFEQLCDEYHAIRQDPTEDKARDRYRKLLVEFGMTPSSRSRLKVSAEKPKDELELFLAGTA